MADSFEIWTDVSSADDDDSIEVWKVVGVGDGGVTTSGLGADTELSVANVLTKTESEL